MDVMRAFIGINCFKIDHVSDHLEFQRDTVLAPTGTRLRGHEFHWSALEETLSYPAYQMTHPHSKNEGYADGNLLASYVHLHFGTDPQLAPNFVQSCHRYRTSRSVFDKQNFL